MLNVRQASYVKYNLKWRDHLKTCLNAIWMFNQRFFFKLLAYFTKIKFKKSTNNRIILNVLKYADSLFSVRSAVLEEQAEQQREMEFKLTGLQKELEILDSSLVRAQAEIDKKQHLIDRRLDEKSGLVESGKSVSPLEAELQV